MCQSFNLDDRHHHTTWLGVYHVEFHLANPRWTVPGAHPHCADISRTEVRLSPGCGFPFRICCRMAPTISRYRGVLSAGMVPPELSDPIIVAVALNLEAHFRHAPLRT
jgi:hypothetical protein